MGRPLKIKKSTTIDIGYPSFADLVNPVYNSANTLNSTQFLGVVGGNNTVDTATYPTVKVRVYIADSYSGDSDGYIIRQKGSHKYLVGTATPIDPANAVAGVSAQIVALGDTNWQEMGAPAGAAVGTIFTVTASAGAGTTGTMAEVGVCILANEADSSLSSGNMNITFSIGDSTAVTVIKLTNKFVTQWNNFVNSSGTTLNTFTGATNAGVVSAVGEDGFVVNFFTDEGTVTKSGAEADTSGDSVSGSGTLFNTSGLSQLGIIENYNS